MDFSFVSWWLLILAFGLGGLVTFLLTVGLTEREVPVTGPRKGGAAAPEADVNAPES